MAHEPNPIDELLVPFDVRVEPLPPEIGLSLPRFFPQPTATTAEGLLCVGGRLNPAWLLDAYRHGIFPWPMWDDEPIAWWSPDPRAIFELDRFYVSRRLRRALKSGKFTVTCDVDFERVIRSCGSVDNRQSNTWLTSAMIDAYCYMHSLGHAHSIEVWDASRRIVGGTYGIAIGGLFAAESMFHTARDASKVALAHLVSHLKFRGYTMLDIQQLTPHTASLGATEIPRLEYLRRLAAATEAPVTFGERLALLEF